MHHRVHPDQSRNLTHRRLAVPGEQDELDAQASPSQRGGGFRQRHVGQMQIQQHHVRPFGSGDRDAGFHIACARAHLDPRVALHEPLHAQMHDRMVIDHEYAHRLRGCVRGSGMHK